MEDIPWTMKKACERERERESKQAKTYYQTSKTAANKANWQMERERYIFREREGSLHVKINFELLVPSRSVWPQLLVSFLRMESE